MTTDADYSWIKSKGYLHLTPQLNIVKRRKEIISKVTNPQYVSRYAFFPLIHSSIKERKYKKISPTSNERKHSYKKNGVTKRTAKSRPLHYAAHMDALIFGYYAQVLQNKYEVEVSKNEELSKAVIAYRKIPLMEGGPNKSTTHFAKEVFEEIKKRSNPDCVVLKYDIKSFFNRMDHKLLIKAWMNLFKVEKLEKDHYNVFKACTRFSYILRDDFRVRKFKGSGRKSGFDVKKLSEIRNQFGVTSFFSSVEEFRNAIKGGEVKIHRFPFRHEKTKFPVGIPQGLPISAVLANLYLLNFDLEVINKVVGECNGFYRRYSDDIIVICKKSEATDIDDFITSSITNSNLEISTEKNEKFIFRKVDFSVKRTELCSIKIVDGVEKLRYPLTYLGFEFYGYKILVKGTSLSKFYRRMIFTVKKKARRAILSAKNNPSKISAIFMNQLCRLYTNRNLLATKIRKNTKYLASNGKGGFLLKTKRIDRKFNTNYLTHINKVNSIMGGNSISRQLRNHTKVLYQALKKQFYKKIVD